MAIWRRSDRFRITCNFQLHTGILFLAHYLLLIRTWNGNWTSKIRCAHAKPESRKITSSGTRDSRSLADRNELMYQINTAKSNFSIYQVRESFTQRRCFGRRRRWPSRFYNTYLFIWHEQYSSFSSLYRYGVYDIFADERVSMRVRFQYCVLTAWLTQRAHPRLRLCCLVCGGDHAAGAARNWQRREGCAHGECCTIRVFEVIESYCIPVCRPYASRRRIPNWNIYSMRNQ